MGFDTIEINLVVVVVIGRSKVNSQSQVKDWSLTISKDFMSIKDGYKDTDLSYLPFICQTKFLDFLT